jgi:hypothetical protein
MLHDTQFPCSTQLVRRFLDVENGSRFLFRQTVVLDHPKSILVSASRAEEDGVSPRVYPRVLAFHLQPSLRRERIDDKVVVAVWAVLVRLVKLLGVLSEDLFALFAGKDHLEALEEDVVLGFGVAFRAIEPFLACPSVSERKCYMYSLWHDALAYCPRLCRRGTRRKVGVVGKG